MTTAEASALESIPADQQGSFSSFLKTLASFTGDLSSLTCPSFLLAPISLLEYSYVFYFILFLIFLYIFSIQDYEVVMDITIVTRFS